MLLRLPLWRMASLEALPNSLHRYWSWHLLLRCSNFLEFPAKRYQLRRAGILLRLSRTWGHVRNDSSPSLRCFLCRIQKWSERCQLNLLLLEQLLYILVVGKDLLLPRFHHFFSKNLRARGKVVLRVLSRKYGAGARAGHFP